MKSRVWIFIVWRIKSIFELLEQIFILLSAPQSSNSELVKQSSCPIAMLVSLLRELFKNPESDTQIFF